LAVDLFADAEHGGFFLAPASPSGDGAAPPLPRTKDLDDTPIPSGNSMLAHVLLRLGRLWGDDELERLAAGVLRLVASGMQRLPTAFGWALCALHLYLAPRRELAAVVGVAASGGDDTVPLLAGKRPVDGKATVYVCERFACRAPVTDPTELGG